MKKELVQLQQKLDITFKDEALLARALVHSSYVNENPSLKSGSNERLEFLGDAVLGLVIGDKLYRDFPEYAEGELTRLRAALVKRETLAIVANSIKLGDYLYLGRGEEASNGREKAANLAGAMEAVIGAVYLDGGLALAEKSILRLFSGELEICKKTMVIDYKSELQTWLQSKYRQTPVYITIETKGPDHARQFTVEVRLDNKVLGKGSGHSKQTAETAAAQDALDKLKDTFTR
ncbi:MAG: ribonuclease III [Dehalococcoidales bacterium]|nr:ribonuclease III [Dehalococcoidales bacterium]